MCTATPRSIGIGRRGARTRMIPVRRRDQGGSGSTGRRAAAPDALGRDRRETKFTVGAPDGARHVPFTLCRRKHALSRVVGHRRPRTKSGGLWTSGRRDAARFVHAGAGLMIYAGRNVGKGCCHWIYGECGHPRNTSRSGSSPVRSSPATGFFQACSARSGSTAGHEDADERHPDKWTKVYGM